MTRLWRLLFGVDPSESEMQRSLVYLAEQTETIRATLARLAAESEKKDPKAKPNPALAHATDPSLPSLASLCQALIGSNRFLYLD